MGFAGAEAHGVIYMRNLLGWLETRLAQIPLTYINYTSLVTCFLCPGYLK